MMFKPMFFLVSDHLSLLLISYTFACLLKNASRQKGPGFLNIQQYDSAFFHLPLQQNHALMTSLCMSSLQCIILVFFYALFVQWSMFCLANIALFAQSSLFGLANIFNALTYLCNRLPHDLRSSYAYVFCIDLVPITLKNVYTNTCSCAIFLSIEYTSKT